MTVDMSQFFQVFFDEAGEHLASMESLLLNLDLEAPSLEDLNAIFRSAHSIKGGSGTFGFSDMTEVTHVLETLLDRLRKEEIALRPEMLDAFLAAGDVLRAQLEHHQGGPKADQESVQAVCVTLNELANHERQRVAHVQETHYDPVSEGHAESRAPRALIIEFTLSADVAADSAAVDNLVDGFREAVACDIQIRPSAKEPRFSGKVITPLSDDDLKEILAFYTDPEKISIKQADVAESAPDDSYGFFEPTTQQQERGYGFFADEPEIKTPETIEAEGYGFFEAAPGTPNPSADESFGLFDDAPGRPEFNHSKSVEPGDVPATVEGEGYGFFIDAPSGLGLFTNAPGSRKAASRPAPIEIQSGTSANQDTPSRRISEQSAADKGRMNRRVSDKAEATAATSSIRVSVEKVDQMINLVGELVITQAMIADAASYLDPAQAEKLLSGIDLLARNTRDLQESVMSIRMLPVSMVFSRFPRVARDLASKLNKQVELRTIGENTELDKSLIETVADPLTHLVRNSLDHGLETPDKRIAAGKTAKGTITLKASHQGGNIVIEVIDDGAGLNRERILAKAKERGINFHDGMTDAEVWQLIMMPGFSTAEVVTDVSGRGVGMDVVKKNIEGLGGRVELESVPGHGTRVIIRLPLTLAILDGMSVGVGGEIFIVPLTAIVESLQPRMLDIKTLAGDLQVIHIRGEYLPIIPLAKVFGQGNPVELEKGIAVVVEGEEGKAALFVDELLGQHQVVIKSLEANYRKVAGISGATIMGDGNVALILDIAAVTRMGLDCKTRQLAA